MQITNLEISSLFCKSCIDLIDQHVPQHNLLSVDEEQHILQPQAEQDQAPPRHGLSSKKQVVSIPTGYLSGYIIIVRKQRLDRKPT